MTSTKLVLTVHTGLTWIPIEWYAESYNLAVLNNVDNPTWNYKNGIISTIVTHYTYIWHHFNRFHLFLVTYSWFSVEIKFYQIFCFDKKIVKIFIDVLSTCIYIYIYARIKFWEWVLYSYCKIVQSEHSIYSVLIGWFSTQALVSFKKYMPPPEVRNRRGHIFFEWNKCLWFSSMSTIVLLQFYFFMTRSVKCYAHIIYHNHCTT